MEVPLALAAAALVITVAAFGINLLTSHPILRLARWYRQRVRRN